MKLYPITRLPQAFGLRNDECLVKCSGCYNEIATSCKSNSRNDSVWLSSHNNDVVVPAFTMKV